MDQAQTYAKQREQQRVRTVLDAAGYQGIPLFNVPYKTLCQAAGLTKRQTSYKGEEQSSFPITGPDPRLRGIIKRVDKKDLTKALMQGKRFLQKELSFRFRPLR